MADLYLDLGGDLQFGPDGDLLLADGVALTNQRLARRFFTNPQVNDAAGNPVVKADYIFHPDYGGGIRQLVDSTVSDQSKKQIEQAMVGQCRLETTVAVFPPPTVDMATSPTGDLSVYLRYQTAQGAAASTGFAISP